MNIALCDDQPDILNTLSPIVESFFRDKQDELVVKTFACLQEIKRTETVFDIAFLDIELPDGNGLQAAAQLLRRNENAIIFIVTSYQQYLDDAMDLNIFRYLSKPVDEERLEKNLQAAWKRYCEQTRTIFIGNHGGATRIFTRDILYVSIKARGTELVTEHGNYESVQSLSYWEEQLNSATFAQPHYSYLVNLCHVVDLKKRELVLLKNGDETITLGVSQRKYAAFKKALFTMIGGAVN